MDLIVNHLNKLGFTINEAKAYIALLPLQEAKASQIASSARIPRSKIYETMQSLHKKGFVEVLPEKVTKFRVVNFEGAIQSYLDTWQHKLENLVETKEKVSSYLRSLPAKTQGEIGEFTILKAKRVIYKKLESVLMGSDKTVYLMLNVSDLRRLYYAAKDASKRIELRVLAPITQDDKNIVKKWMKFAYIHHYETKTQVKLAIHGDSEVMVFHTNEPVALYSKDRQFTALLNGFFQSAWESSPLGIDKIAEIETGKPVEEVVRIRGRKEIYDSIRGLIDKSQRDVFINASTAGLVRVQRYLGKNIDYALKRGVRVRCLAHITNQNMKTAKQFNVEIRHMEKPQGSTTSFYDSYLLMLHIRKDTPTLDSPEDYAIITNQGSTVETLRQLYEDVWASSTPLAERLKELETGKPVEKVEILKGEEIQNVTKAESEKARKEICTMATELSPEMAVKIGIAAIDHGRAANGVKVRYIFPVTKRNVHVIKELMKHAEVRHIEFSPVRMRILDGKNCFVSYGDESTQENVCMHSRSSNYISAMKSYFESTWLAAVPAEERIRQIEKGEPLREVRHLHGRENIYALLPDFIRSAKEDIIWMTSPNGLKRLYRNLKPNIDEALKRGVRVRCLTKVTQENMPLIKELGMEVRHIDNVYAIADCYDDSLLTIMQIKNDTEDIKSPEDLCIITNHPDTVKMVRQFLETTWEDAVSAENRIKEMESGIPTGEFNKVVESPVEGFQHAVRLVSSARKSVNISTSSTGLRKLVDAYPFEKLKGRVKIRIICPVTKQNADTVNYAMGFAELRHVNEAALRATIVDDREAITVIMGHDRNPAGSVYSNNRNLVTSVKSFFDGLWENAVDAKEIIGKLP